MTAKGLTYTYNIHISQRAMPSGFRWQNLISTANSRSGTETPILVARELCSLAWYCWKNLGKEEPWWLADDCCNILWNLACQLPQFLMS